MESSSPTTLVQVPIAIDSNSVPTTIVDTIEDVDEQKNNSRRKRKKFTKLSNNLPSSSSRTTTTIVRKQKNNSVNNYNNCTNNNNNNNLTYDDLSFTSNDDDNSNNEMNGSSHDDTKRQLSSSRSHGCSIGRPRTNVVSTSLPIILLEREYSRISRTSTERTIWQRRMLLQQNRTTTPIDNYSNDNSDPKQPQPKNEWRNYCHRRIPFTQLKTPKTDAVLGIDSCGSYLICIGGKYQKTSYDNEEYDNDEYNSQQQQHDSVNETTLALRLYGIQNRLSNSIPNERLQSPLVLSIPIAYQSHDESSHNNNNNNAVFGAAHWDMNLSLAPPPALFPIRIWISSDGCIGILIVRLWYHEGWTGCSKHVRLVLFPLPRMLVVDDSGTELAIPTLVLDKVPVDRTGRQKPTFDTNLLWNVTIVPYHVANDPVIREKGCSDLNGSQSSNNSLYLKSSSFCHHILETSGYLFVFDDEDGYRLNWIYYDRSTDIQCHSVEQYLGSEVTKLNNSNNDNKIKTEWSQLENLMVDLSNDGNGWQTNWSDRMDGSWISASEQENISRNGMNQMKVACSAFLSVKALLYHLLTRFPNLAPKVQQNSGSDTAEGRPPIILPNYTYDLVSVLDGGRKIEILLVFALPGKKIKEQQQQSSRAKSVGVFIVIDLLTQQYKTINWLRSNFSVDDDDFIQISHLVLERRRQYIQEEFKYSSASTLESCPNDEMLLSLLYPDCQTFDNAAVRKQRPVYRIQARSSPIELYYG